MGGTALDTLLLSLEEIALQSSEIAEEWDCEQELADLAQQIEQVLNSYYEAAAEEEP